jgi:hypothetical protein
MDALLIAIAFVLGLVAQQFRLPPMVGFLIAGFILRAVGQEGGEGLATIADMGVTLLLFSIGLKLRVRALGRPEIWAGTSLHMVLVLLFFGPIIFLSAWLLGPAVGVNWGVACLLAFAFSFSSTCLCDQDSFGKRGSGLCSWQGGGWDFGDARYNGCALFDGLNWQDSDLVVSAFDPGIDHGAPSLGLVDESLGAWRIIVFVRTFAGPGCGSGVL